MGDMVLHNAPLAHVRYDGRSWDIPLGELDLGPRSSDEDVRVALAHHFDVPARKFAAYVVERHANGNLTVRPEAVFG
jgi:hypothetical protein